MNAAWGNPGKWGAAGCSSALAQAGVEGGGLHCEVVGTALAEGFEIAQLPAQCRQLSGVLALHQRPVRFCAHQPAQKLVEIGRAHVRTPVPNAHLVCSRLLDTKQTKVNE